MKVSTFSRGSITCGGGKRQRALACFDTSTGTLLDILDCGEAASFQEDECSVGTAITIVRTTIMSIKLVMLVQNTRMKITACISFSHVFSC